MKLIGHCPKCGCLIQVTPKRSFFPKKEWDALWKKFDDLMDSVFGKGDSHGKRDKQ